MSFNQIFMEMKSLNVQVIFGSIYLVALAFAEAEPSRQNSEDFRSIIGNSVHGAIGLINHACSFLVFLDLLADKYII
jgi:hypothetical protein